MYEHVFSPGSHLMTERLLLDEKYLKKGLTYRNLYDRLNKSHGAAQQLNLQETVRIGEVSKWS